MDKILFRELECYKMLDVETQKRYKIGAGNCFDLTKIEPETVRNEVSDYLLARGKVLSVKSMLEEKRFFQIWSLYAAEKLAVASLSECDMVEEERALKKWLFLHGYSMNRVRHKKYDNDCRKENDVILFYRRLLKAFERDVPEVEKDIWQMDKLDFLVRGNPVKQAATLNFTRIEQKKVRSEVKKVIEYQLQIKKVGTVQAELLAIERFASYLADVFPEIKSLGEVGRKHMEVYLTYINTEAERKKSYRSELHHLKTVLEMAGKVFAYKNLSKIMLLDDIPKNAKCLFRSYSDAELRRLNEGILMQCDEQTARIWVLQELLGTRISEVLALRSDCICAPGKVKIMQYKTERSYIKHVTDDIIHLIEKAKEYTVSHYGEREYIFVSSRNPDRPLPYGTFSGRIKKAIMDADLRDDKGQFFSVETHMLRHTYGCKLAEAGYDDVLIAKLLGHKNIRSVHCYRKLGQDYLSKETEEFRERKDKLLLGVLKELV